MKYAVTGANGMIGRFLVERLAKEGHEVVAICRSNVPKEFGTFKNVRLANGDILDLDFLSKNFQNVDGAFHVAAFAKPWAKDKRLYYQVNELGTQNVCQAAMRAEVKRLVLTSSAGIHGAQPMESLVDEDTWPLKYDTDYEQSKFNGKVKALSFTEHGLEVVVVSPARVYAPGTISESNVPVRMMNLYLRNRFGFVPTNGQGVGSYVHVDDVVSGHLLAMQGGSSGEEYLLGGTNATYLEFFEAVAEVSGKNYPVLKIPYPASLMIGKSQLFLAESLGVQPKITTPWVRKYLKNWGVDSGKISKLGYNPVDLRVGLKHVFETTF